MVGHDPFYGIIESKIPWAILSLTLLQYRVRELTERRKRTYWLPSSRRNLKETRVVTESFPDSCQWRIIDLELGASTIN